MKLLIVVLLAFMCVPVLALPDGQTLANLDWDTVVDGAPEGISLPPSVTATIDNRDGSNDHSLFELEVRYAGNSALQLKLLPTPSNSRLQDGANRIVTHHYAIIGEVRYENVSTGSYLEMWSYFDSSAPGYPEGAYFSRTMADGGPMGRLEGTSNWREFWLPFDSTGTKSRLNRLEMNLHLTGPGTVHFRQMKLVQYPDTVAATTSTSAKPVDRVMVNLTQPDGGPLHLTMEGTDYSTFAAFEAAAKKLTQTNPQTGFVLRGTEDIAYSNVKDALDALRRSGATNIFFANDPTKNSGGGDGRKLPSESLDWRSFIFGVLAAMAAIFGAAMLFVLGRRFQRLRHARELRRIASLDG